LFNFLKVSVIRDGNEVAPSWEGGLQQGRAREGGESWKCDAGKAEISETNDV
jgi:hypothetical protein